MKELKVNSRLRKLIAHIIWTYKKIEEKNPGRRLIDCGVSMQMRNVCATKTLTDPKTSQCVFYGSDFS